ncbi:hypothetical protein CTEN210_03621 [Chaetoceros tenuissimus]|uniref:RING-type domain-containing protein n=1 Tax=Chaetoceros tenuissimus TaxID=426638 RepID=A0AAD3H1S6_9STRA|nr:hypothetical protein CTEN210_03621 [Chaetoceros tenuissimus]
MSQQQHQERELRRSSRTRNRKSYNDYFSDDDTLTEHEDDDIEEQEDLEEEEEYEDASDDEHIQEEQEEASDDNSDREETQENIGKDINHKFACGLCSNTLSDPYIIPACCHRFCCTCIQESLKAGVGPCPTCRDHSVSFQSLRRDEMMGRLLTRYKKLQEKIQKKHDTQKKRTFKANELVQEGIDDMNKATESRARKRQKRESSNNELHDLKYRKERQFFSTKKNVTIQEGKKQKKFLTFEERLCSLRDFKKKYGHVNVPRSYGGLGIWCSTMRSIKAGTSKRLTHPDFKLTKERMKVLEDMGFRWTTSTSPTFDEYFHELRIYKERHGHCYVPNEYKENKKLGNWCAKIRMMKKGTLPIRNTGSYKLTQERIKRLEDLGFQWRHTRYENTGKTKTKSFDYYFSALQTFKEEKGHCNVPASYKTGDCSLGSWVVRIRRMKAGTMPSFKDLETKLTDARIAKLDALGFEWVATFEDYVRDLKAYKAKHGDCYVSRKDKDHMKLKRWVSKLRAIRAGTVQPVSTPSLQLTEERIKELDSIGFKWTGWKSFDDYIEDLRQFKSMHGHCDVPYVYSENKSLGFWVGKIRRKKLGKTVNNGGPGHKLTKERIVQLDEMGFKWSIRS